MSNTPTYLQKLLCDSLIEDIVLSPKGVSFYSEGSWKGPEQDVSCESKNLISLARRIADRCHINLGLTQPSADSFVDFQGEYLFRAHVVIPPMVLQGPEITLRRLPKAHQFKLENFCDDPQLIDKLTKAISSRKSLLIAGSTGAGKSSLMTACLNLLPESERIVILEDSPELPLPNSLSTKLVARNDRFGFREGAEWDLCHLVFESLRMRPDRIIVGECRGPEARAIAQALMTGHRGVWTTLHAGSCQQALERFYELVKSQASLEQFSPKDYWDFVLHMDVDAQGKRKIRELLEIS